MLCMYMILNEVYFEWEIKKIEQAEEETSRCCCM